MYQWSENRRSLFFGILVPETAVCFPLIPGRLKQFARLRRDSDIGLREPGRANRAKPDPNSLKEEAFHSRRNILW